MEPAVSADPAINIFTERVAPLTINRDLTGVTHYVQDVDRIPQPVVQVNNSISEVVTPLKHEFHNILTGQTNLALNSSSLLNSMTDSTISEITDTTISELQDEYIMDGLSAEAITALRSIAGSMSSVGHLRECVDVYKCVRKPFVDTYFRRLGIDNFSIGDSKKIPLDDLKKKIDVWIRAARVCIQILFKREKRVYEQIFEGIGTAATYEAGFIGTVKDASVQLFKFADAVSCTPRHANKLFKILDFYNALSDLSPDIGCLFPLDSPRSSIKIDTSQLLSRLNDVVGKTLSDFEHSLVHEVSTIVEPGGSVIRLTRFVMDYVSRILEHKKILNQLIASNPPTSFGVLEIPDMEFVTPREGQTPLGLHMILIIVVLRFNLECKFKSYEDSSLPTAAPEIHRTLFHLFMMSNDHYIVQHIRGSPGLKDITGDEYLDRLSKKVREDMNASRTLICDRILYCLRDEGLRGTTCVSNGVSKSVVRERIKMFNTRLEEVQKCQSTWVVPEVQLRDELRQSISTKLVPAYETFLSSYGSNIENRRYPNIIKYSVEELRTFISTFFS